MSLVVQLIEETIEYIYAIIRENITIQLDATAKLIKTIKHYTKEHCN